MARTDYIQPDPIKGFKNNQQQIVRGDANSTRQRMKVNPGVGYKQQATTLGSKIVNSTAGLGKSLLGGVDTLRNSLSTSSSGMRLNIQPGANTQNDLARLGDNLQGIGSSVAGGLESLGRTMAQPFEQGGVVNNFGRDLGGMAYDATHSQNQQPQAQPITNQGLGAQPAQTGSNPISVGSPESRAAHQEILDKYGIQNTPASTDAPGTNQTSKYRDAIITEGQQDSEGDRLGVSFGNGAGSVSGLNPEQAARIQKSLAKGNQASGFNMDNMIASTRSDADGKIMESMRSGDINTDKASALMNRDYRASDRMDRLGGNAEAYIKPDAAPTNIQEAMAYGQDLNNFTRNGELNENQALLAQQNYLKSIGGFTGVANAAGKKANSKLIMQKQYDKDGIVVGESPYVFDPNDKSFNSLGGGQDKSGTTPEEVMNWYSDPKSSEKAKKQYSDLFMEIYGVPIEQYMSGSKA